MAKTIYEKSNEITSVRLNSFSKVYAHEVLLSLESSCDREENAQILLDYLCKKFKIERVTLSVTPAARPCNRRNIQTYGCYYPASRRIVIFNTTAKTKKTIAIKTFYETLLHEFIHHYDMVGLKLGDSPHTSGFYKRIGDLKEKLGN